MPAELICFEERCRARFPITDVIYNCPHCGGLLEVWYPPPAARRGEWKRIWRERRTSNGPLDQSGVWRYREIIPFLESLDAVVTLREGHTPLLPAPPAAAYGGLDALTFKHQGFNPTGSFKDNGMTCGIAQALRLGMPRVACVSTGNTFPPMAAWVWGGGVGWRVFPRATPPPPWPPTPAPQAWIRSSSFRTAISRTASWPRRSNMARRLCRWRQTSTRFWPWCARLPNVSVSTC